MREDAIEHLRAAVERRPSFRDLAKEDTGFDPIRASRASSGRRAVTR
jgi:hypothetical protein